MSGELERGAPVLRQWLGKRLLDLRDLDAGGFRRWLEPHLSGWSADPVFLQRTRIRDLRRANPELQSLEGERHRARQLYQASPDFDRIEAAQRELTGAENAVAGLTHAHRVATEAGERERLAAKLGVFRDRAEESRERLRELVMASGQRQALDRVSAKLAAAREEVGFAREVARLEELQRKQGRSSGRSGAAFERAASEVVRGALLPELAGRSSDSLAILHGATLGAARTELDQLVVRPAGDPETPVEVVAVIEAKRNPNDLAHGFLRRLENLSWLAGHREGYEAEAYRTASSPGGHFDGEARHIERGVRYAFTRDSFARFLPDLQAAAIPRDLYLVTRIAPLWGIASSGLSRIAHRISSDLHWDPEDPAYLEDLLRWCQTLCAGTEAPDLLRRYTADEERARRVLLLPAPGDLPSGATF
jgi:hypothetical protein